MASKSLQGEASAFPVATTSIETLLHMLGAVTNMTELDMWVADFTGARSTLPKPDLYKLCAEYGMKRVFIEREPGK
ncbi:MAG: hypothetical protein EON59_10280 [Alphaproteobacteria bacterium]|nr:MAG: hypothetical protein EON59_10280 [Alphaproteobacteria bacterium]